MIFHRPVTGGRPDAVARRQADPAGWAGSRPRSRPRSRPQTATDAAVQESSDTRSTGKKNRARITVRSARVRQVEPRAREVGSAATLAALCDGLPTPGRSRALQGAPGRTPAVIRPAWRNAARPGSGQGGVVSSSPALDQATETEKLIHPGGQANPAGRPGRGGKCHRAKAQPRPSPAGKAGSRFSRPPVGSAVAAVAGRRGGETSLDGECALRHGDSKNRYLALPAQPARPCPAPLRPGPGQPGPSLRAHGPPPPASCPLILCLFLICGADILYRHPIASCAPCRTVTQKGRKGKSVLRPSLCAPRAPRAPRRLLAHRAHRAHRVSPAGPFSRRAPRYQHFQNPHF